MYTKQSNGVRTFKSGLLNFYIDKEVVWVRCFGLLFHLACTPPLFSERTNLKKSIKLWGGWRFRVSKEVSKDSV